MQTIKKMIAEKLADGIASLGAPGALTTDELTSMLEYPPDEGMGDLALPCFKLSRTLRRAPVQIAAALCDCLSGLDAVEKAEAGRLSQLLKHSDTKKKARALTISVCFLQAEFILSSITILLRMKFFRRQTLYLATYGLL